MIMGAYAYTLKTTNHPYLTFCSDDFGRLIKEDKKIFLEWTIQKGNDSAIGEDARITIAIHTAFNNFFYGKLSRSVELELLEMLKS